MQYKRHLVNAVSEIDYSSKANKRPCTHVLTFDDGTVIRAVGIMSTLKAVRAHFKKEQQ